MVTIQRTTATLLCVALLAHGLYSSAFAAVSNVNFKFVDPNQAGAQQNTSADTTSVSTQEGGSNKADTPADKSAAPAADSQASNAEETSDDTVSAKDGGMQKGKLGTSDQDSQSDASAANQASVNETSASEASSASETSANEAPSTSEAPAADATVKPGESEGGKILQGYVRVVPSGTKVPIIMDTAVDSDTSQEGDEFSARTGEDLDIDGTTVVPAGSTIRGRVAQLNLPRRMDRSGSVALKFDTITTPDNRQIPLVANLVARGGVVHARRGLKDIAIDTSAVAVPTLAGLGIGLIAAKASSSSSIGAGGGALIGAGLGVAVGVAILLAKKGKKVDVRPGDELKIELAEDLRMPM
jgi:hypothetical protein